MYSVHVMGMPTKHYVPPLRLSLGISHLWLGECLQIERQTNNTIFFGVPFNLIVARDKDSSNTTHKVLVGEIGQRI